MAGQGQLIGFLISGIYPAEDAFKEEKNMR